MRKYAPIWNELKDTKKASIVAPKPFHARIIKAVIKEKYEDVGFKYQMQETGQRPRLEHITEGPMIKFRLVYDYVMEKL